MALPSFRPLRHNSLGGSLLTHFLLLVSLLIFLTSFLLVNGLEKNDRVAVSLNKVWPYHNSVETYGYYDVLPFCHPPHIEWQHMSFGQIMRGDRLVNSLYAISYQIDEPERIVCSRRLTEEEAVMLRRVIDEAYQFEVYVADLPFNGPVGAKIMQDDGSFKYYLVTTLNFHLDYNDGAVVNVNITTTDNPLDISPGVIRKDFSPPGYDLQLRYSVNWKASTVPKSARFQKQLSGVLTPPSRGLDIHWLAITNSFVLVLFVTSLLLLIILRVVRTDLAKYLRIPDEELVAGEDETGWKLLHADVFRPPPHRMWFCACIGSGAHLFLVTIVMVVVGCFSSYLERGALLSGGIFAYLLTSFVAGYISANLYRRLGGVKWGWNIVVTVLMFMGPVFLVWSFLNTIAIVYKSTTALPFSTATFFFACWLFVTLPLTILGGVMGRKRASKALETSPPFPCKTNKLAREIPTVQWRNSPWLHSLVAGLLPFSAIYIELHYIFMSVWGTKVYTLYGVLLMAFVMLLLVAATLSVLLTYFHLNGEDHKWWWRSLASGGSVSFFFYLHCIYYFFTTTRMFGFLQCAFFFGYSLLVAWALLLVVGFVTFASTYTFVTYIYSNIKSE